MEYPLTSTCFALLSGILFYLRWNNSKRLDIIPKIIQLPHKQTLLIISSVLAMLSLVGIDYIIKTSVILIRKEDVHYCRPYSELQIYFFILLSAVLLVTLNSKCSPLYYFNDWDDANTIFTVGKSILRGKVPYRDLYEQKGPLLLFLQVPGAAISFTSLPAR